MTEKRKDILRIEKVTQRYDAFTALDELSLIVPEGNIYGLLGPNGAGKTTLIRLINGLIRPDEGTITLFGNTSPGSDVARSLIGYMPQSISIYPGLTVYQNLLFFGRIYGLRGKQLEERAREVMTETNLDKKKDTDVASLSGGMARRVSLGAALMHRPRLLILDEPTAGVDPLLRIKIWETLRALVERGTSILITTHHIAEAERCDLAVFLREGKKMAEGTPAELKTAYNAPDLETAFVRATLEVAEVKP